MDNEKVIHTSLSQVDSVINANLSLTENLNSNVSEGGGGVSDYTKLANKPSINGTPLVGNYNEIDPTVPSWAKDDEPEEITGTHIEFVWQSIFGN